MEVLVSQYHPGQSSTLFSPKKKYNEAAHSASERGKNGKNYSTITYEYMIYQTRGFWGQGIHFWGQNFNLSTLTSILLAGFLFDGSTCQILSCYISN